MRLRVTSAAALASLSAAVQTGCVFVGGYSSKGGFYVWPGSIVITAVLVLLLWLFLRRRRG
jgi:hypothetical protein